MPSPGRNDRSGAPRVLAVGTTETLGTPKPGGRGPALPTSLRAHVQVAAGDGARRRCSLPLLLLSGPTRPGPVRSSRYRHCRCLTDRTVRHRTVPYSTLPWAAQPGPPPTCHLAAVQLAGLGRGPGPSGTGAGSCPSPTHLPPTRASTCCGGTGRSPHGAHHVGPAAGDTAHRVPHSPPGFRVSNLPVWRSRGLAVWRGRLGVRQRSRSAADSCARTGTVGRARSSADASGHSRRIRSRQAYRLIGRARWAGDRGGPKDGEQSLAQGDTPRILGFLRLSAPLKEAFSASGASWGLRGP